MLVPYDGRQVPPHKLLVIPFNSIKVARIVTSMSNHNEILSVHRRLRWRWIASMTAATKDIHLLLLNYCHSHPILHIQVLKSCPTYLVLLILSYTYCHIDLVTHILGNVDCKLDIYMCRKLLINMSEIYCYCWLYIWFNWHLVCFGGMWPINGLRWQGEETYVQSALTFSDNVPSLLLVLFQV
jgi:hypothetical protein